MKNLFFASVTCFLMLTSLMVNAQADDKSFVRTLNPSLSSMIVMDVKAPVSGKQWEESTMRVLLYVTLENANEAVLKQLAQIGRYGVEGRVEEDKFIVSVPALSKEVTIKGQKLVENVKVEVLVPGGILVANNDGQTIQIESERLKQLQAAGLAMKGAPVFKPFDCEVQMSALQNNEVISADDILIGGVKLSELPKN